MLIATPNVRPARHVIYNRQIEVLRCQIGQVAKQSKGSQADAAVGATYADRATRLTSTIANWVPLGPFREADVHPRTGRGHPSTGEGQDVLGEALVITNLSLTGTRRTLSFLSDFGSATTRRWIRRVGATQAWRELKGVACPTGRLSRKGNGSRDHLKLGEKFGVEGEFQVRRDKTDSP